MPASGAEGVLLAQGGRFGGFSLHVQAGRVHYAYNFAGLERTVLASDPLSPGRHVVVARLVPGRGISMHAELLVDGARAGEADIPHTAPFRFALAGEGMCCGYAGGTPVVESYAPPFPFSGVLHDVTIDVSGTPVADESAEAERAWMVQ
jgi:arylsulfatase